MLARFDPKRTDWLPIDAVMVDDFATIFDAKCADADIAMFGDIRAPAATAADDDDDADDVCFNTVVAKLIIIYAITVRL